MSSLLKTVLIDVEHNRVEEIEIEDKLDAFYDKLNCRCIDIVEREIDGNRFLVMCDDEGWLKHNAIISAINSNGEIMFVRNLMFFHEDTEGNLVSLSKIDVSNILMNVTAFYGHLELVNCEYC